MVWCCVVLCVVIVRERPQFGHGLVNHRPRFLIMNERGEGGGRGEPGGARWRVEPGHTWW